MWWGGGERHGGGLPLAPVCLVNSGKSQRYLELVPLPEVDRPALSGALCVCGCEEAEWRSFTVILENAAKTMFSYFKKTYFDF